MRSARAGRALPDSRRRLSAVAVGVALLARAMAAGEDAPPIPSEIVRLKVESANFSASATSCAGSSFMPHSGQWPGSSLTTSGCIGQV